MSYSTFSGNKLLMTVLAAGALAVGGTGVAAMADSVPDSPVAAATESPTPTETETPEPTPTETETPEPEPTETETAEAEPTETADPEPEPTETDEPEGGPTSTPVGPDVTGAAAVGLCNAFENGGLNSTSTAYTVLMQVAGGDEAIDDYCATIPAPQDIEDGTDDGTHDGAVQPQGVELQREGASGSNGSNGGARHQGNSAKNSNQGQR
ncbi:hypothetical protein C3B78_04325 [Arthrobacter sp. PGP41]|uniref:hypothetical protein n=1 Tax=Arthrobacter sp. PGP41 TaxID=2079227 RepID=UPI000CDC0405|nr:hypothetical protein [Arthrobacter sp. PGP41]AUZ33762.1 hypothetical protein C3B78_04325 [Arthrobacter sp. PGP41]